MSRRLASLLAAPLLVVLLALAGRASSQSPAPTAYTVTEVNGLFGQPFTMTIYRDGQVAVIDHTDSHSRAYNDLAKGRSFSWSTTDASPECGTGSFTGDWGDPFGRDFLADLEKMSPKPAGTEVVNGIHTKVMTAKDPKSGGAYRLWVDQTYGELVKLEGPNPSGGVVTMIELKSVTVGKPPASVFVMPASCAKAAQAPAPPRPPPPPTEAEAIAAATGAAPGKYVRGTFGPGSNESCKVLFSIVQRKTLAPIAVPFRLGIDPKLDVQNAPHYEMGGTPLFKGGGLHDVTDQLKNGVVALDGLSPAFDVEVLYGNPGGGGFTFSGHANSAYIYKQCFGKRTSKLLLVVDAARLEEPAEWLWEK